MICVQCLSLLGIVSLVLVGIFNVVWFACLLFKAKSFRIRTNALMMFSLWIGLLWSANTWQLCTIVCAAPALRLIWNVSTNRKDNFARMERAVLSLMSGLSVSVWSAWTFWAESIPSELRHRLVPECGHGVNHPQMFLSVVLPLLFLFAVALVAMHNGRPIRKASIMFLIGFNASFIWMCWFVASARTHDVHDVMSFTFNFGMTVVGPLLFGILIAVWEPARNAFLSQLKLVDGIPAMPNTRLLNDLRNRNGFPRQKEHINKF